MVLLRVAMPASPATLYTPYRVPVETLYLHASWHARGMIVCNDDGRSTITNSVTEDFTHTDV
jgi:hypothetical protein